MNARTLDYTIFTGHVRILACDPGKTTGWANLTWMDEHGGVPVYNAGELPAWEYADWVAKMLTPQDLLVCEAYVITPKTAKLSQQTEPLELIGALRWLCRDRHATFQLQKASDAKSFDPRGEKLKQLDMWPTSSDHAQDAARHLLLACVKYKMVDLRRLILR